MSHHDDDNLERPMRLGNNTLNALAEVVLHVVDRYDNANERFAAHTKLLSEIVKP